MEKIGYHIVCTFGAEKKQWKLYVFVLNSVSTLGCIQNDLKVMGKKAHIQQRFVGDIDVLSGVSQLGHKTRS